MAQYRWVGTAATGAKTDWKNVGNWVDASTGAGVTNYPGDTALQYDDALFDTAIVSAGGQPCAGVSTLTERLNKLYIGGTYDTTLGSASTPIVLDAAIAVIRPTGASDLYISGASATKISRLIIEGGDVHLGGYLGNTNILKATSIDIDPAATIVGLWIGYKSVQATDVTLEIPTGVTIPNYVHINGGTITSNKGIANLVMAGGTFNSYSYIEGLTMFGGTCNLKASSITAASLYGGVLDCTTTATPKSLDMATVGAGSTLKLNDSVTIGTGGVIPLGGTIEWATGTAIKPV